MGDLASTQSMTASMGRSRPGRNTALEIVSPRGLLYSAGRNLSRRFLLFLCSLIVHRKVPLRDWK